MLQGCGDGTLSSQQRATVSLLCLHSSHRQSNLPSFTHNLHLCRWSGVLRISENAFKAECLLLLQLCAGKLAEPQKEKNPSTNKRGVCVTEFIYRLIIYRLELLSMQLSV